MSFFDQYNGDDSKDMSESNPDTLSQENQPPRVAVRTKLHVSNFPENCTRRMLTEFFGKFGVVLECAIMWDKYAFIHYGTMAEAQNALKQASHMYFMGNKLSIKLSTSRNRQSCDWYQHEAAKLAMKLQQGDLDMDSESGYFVETKLYVTNLPENCNQVELSNLFAQYGTVLECVIMWNHYAFVHFQDLREAKIALSHLNGYDYNGKILVVQLSNSSNRPLPKCLAFEQRKNYQPDLPAQRNGPTRQCNSMSSSSTYSNCSSRSDQSLEPKTSYQASADQSVITAPPATDPAPKKDWIQLLKTGSLNLLMPQETNNNSNNRQTTLLSSVDQVPTLKPELSESKNGNHFGSFDVRKLFNAVIFEEDEEEKGDTIEEFVNDKCHEEEDDDDELDNCNSSADIDSDLCSLNEAWSHRIPSQRNEEALGSPVSVCSSKSSASSVECSWINSMGGLTLDQIPTPPLPTNDITAAAAEALKIKDLWPSRAIPQDQGFTKVHLDSELLPFTIPLKSLSVNYTTSSESLSSGSMRPSSISTTGSSHHSPSNLSEHYSSDSLLSSGNFEETIMNPSSSAYLTSIDRNSTHTDNSLLMNFIESTKGQLTSSLDQRFVEPQLLQYNQREPVQQPSRAQPKVKLTRCRALNYILFPELKNGN